MEMDLLTREIGYVLSQRVDLDLCTPLDRSRRVQ